MRRWPQAGQARSPPAPRARPTIHPLTILTHNPPHTSVFFSMHPRSSISFIVTGMSTAVAPARRHAGGSGDASGSPERCAHGRGSSTDTVQPHAQQCPRGTFRTIGSTPIGATSSAERHVAKAVIHQLCFAPELVQVLVGLLSRQHQLKRHQVLELNHLCSREHLTMHLIQSTTTIITPRPNCSLPEAASAAHARRGRWHPVPAHGTHRQALEVQRLLDLQVGLAVQVGGLHAQGRAWRVGAERGIAAPGVGFHASRRRTLMKQTFSASDE